MTDHDPKQRYGVLRDAPLIAREDDDPRVIWTERRAGPDDLPVFMQDWGPRVPDRLGYLTSIREWWGDLVISDRFAVLTMILGIVAIALGSYLFWGIGAVCIVMGFVFVLSGIASYKPKEED